MNLGRILGRTTQWFSRTPQRALDRAYKAAIAIKEIEDKYFNGKQVSQSNANYSKTAVTYFENEVNGYLKTIDIALTTFRTSRFFINLTDRDQSSPLETDYQPEDESIQDEQRSLILEKLNYIDHIISGYKQEKSSQMIASAETDLNLSQKDNSPAQKSRKNQNSNYQPGKPITKTGKDAEKVTEKSGVLPRSFLTTFNRIKQDIDPQSEETESNVVKKYRKRRYQTAVSIKFILLLIIVPLLTHQLTKTLLLTPIVEQYFDSDNQIVFVNKDLEEEALMELKHYEETLHFKSLIGFGPTLTPDQEIEKVKEKAQEISESFKYRSYNAITNIFADVFSLAAFAMVIVTNRKDIEIVKSFLDEIFYTLSDSAKAFLIILFTDMFVGFHSPHGWEVILESIAHHFGLPGNRQFNFLFIATFPVILDTILKYWIFRYLNRISPSAVATYRNMNE